MTDHDDQGTRVERRAHERFAMERPVRYTVAGRNAGRQGGSGTTVDMSSSGVLFTTEEPVSPGRKVDVSISWPAQLNERCALRFVAHGHIVRAEGNTAAMEIARYEFRTEKIARDPGPIPIRPTGQQAQ